MDADPAAVSGKRERGGLRSTDEERENLRPVSPMFGDRRWPGDYD